MDQALLNSRLFSSRVNFIHIYRIHFATFIPVQDGIARNEVAIWENHPPFETFAGLQHLYYWML